MHAAFAHIRLLHQLGVAGGDPQALALVLHAVEHDEAGIDAPLAAIGHLVALVQRDAIVLLQAGFLVQPHGSGGFDMLVAIGADAQIVEIQFIGRVFIVKGQQLDGLAHAALGIGDIDVKLLANHRDVLALCGDHEVVGLEPAGNAGESTRPDCRSRD